MMDLKKSEQVKGRKETEQSDQQQRGTDHGCENAELRGEGEAKGVPEGKD